MRKRAEGLNWIDKGNSAQIEWAVDYLKKRGKLSKVSATFGADYKALMEEGLDLEKSVDGVRTLQRMQAAWRQRNYRQPHHGRKPYTFTLPIQTKHHLSEQAEKCRHTETEHLVQLIEQGHEEAIRHSKWIKESQAKARKDLPKAKADAVWHQIRAGILEEYLEQCLRERFTTEGTTSEELDRKVEHQMDNIRRQVWKALEEQRETNPRLKHQSAL